MSSICYTVIIDGKECTLLFAREHKNRFIYCDIGSDLSAVGYSFSQPLAKYPINTPFKENNHTYIIKTKP